MQRGLGGNPHERLHQDTGILRRSDAARSWGGSAVLGVPPMSDCRGFPHERLHQDTGILRGTGILPVSIYFRAGRSPLYSYSFKD
ncbi:hypothetical protein [Moorena sp. SIO3H5]|uniref:hypothetical protein n=1 Tax=Moorena sp. SIO3H5 TaxID=2607834 RepID=UPI0013BC32E6|nr:hypothetical protein [Moorena sp. SIO3H5]NEO71614.1 hypothetical protein [Moorena sp. SIO3H5]